MYRSIQSLSVVFDTFKVSNTLFNAQTRNIKDSLETAVVFLKFGPQIKLGIVQTRPKINNTIRFIDHRHVVLDFRVKRDSTVSIHPQNTKQRSYVQLCVSRLKIDEMRVGGMEARARLQAFKSKLMCTTMQSNENVCCVLRLQTLFRICLITRGRDHKPQYFGYNFITIDKNLVSRKFLQNGFFRFRSEKFFKICRLCGFFERILSNLSNLSILQFMSIFVDFKVCFISDVWVDFRLYRLGRSRRLHQFL